MRIRWLNAEASHAIITRGFGWWKEAAEVEWVANSRSKPDDWRYTITGDPCEMMLEKSLDRHRRKHLAASKRRRTWQRCGALPMARVLK